MRSHGVYGVTVCVHRQLREDLPGGGPQDDPEEEEPGGEGVHGSHLPPQDQILRLQRSRTPHEGPYSMLVLPSLVQD